MEQKQKASKTRRSLLGVVVGSQRDKTISVKVTRRIKHPLYGKYITKSSILHAHDEKNEAGVGDRVTLGETRPISKSKFFKLLTISKKAGA
ncbi:MAG: 30S ribosomal protein S17 [Gammaproteobacteria bacterium]|nr:30S ribosomal protein S17 [Gammaproteobacteria bacterium]